MCIACLSGAQTAIQTAVFVGAPTAYGLWRRVAPRLGVRIRTYNEEHGIDPVDGDACRPVTDDAPERPLAGSVPRS